MPHEKHSDGSVASVVGGLIGFPTGVTSFQRRISAELAVDYTELGRREFIDPDFGRAASIDHEFLLTPRAVITALRTPRFVIDGHVGAGFLLTRSTFALESTPDTEIVLRPGMSSNTGDDFENVCDLAIVANRCRNRYDTGLAVGAGFRFLRRAGGSLFFGADYGWYRHRRHQIVATIGMMAR